MFNYFIAPNKFIKQIAPSAENLPQYSKYVEPDIPSYFRYAPNRDAWMRPIVCPNCKAESAAPQLYSRVIDTSALTTVEVPHPLELIYKVNLKPLIA